MQIGADMVIFPVWKIVPERMIRMSRKAVKWCVAGLCLAGFLAIAFNLKNVAPIDDAVYGVISSWISPAASAFFIGCSSLVGPILLLALSLVLVLILPDKEYRIPILINVSVAVVLNLMLKNVFIRPRPDAATRIITEVGHSFPSGHTMTAACFYGFMIYLTRKLCRRRALRNAVTALLCTVIALVALSRVYLGVHYFTDVLGGLLISAFYLIVFTTLVERFFAGEESFKPKGIIPDGRNRLLYSFMYAIQGVASGLKSERNMVIHFSMIATVTVFGALLGISRSEWIACVILFGAVVMAELINTSIETVVDIICPEYDPRAKVAKDTAAGAVLMISIAAAIVGVVIFAPKILELITAQLGGA